jgi:coenzyme F420-0:L-glutamate ligase/coenzyme F420-1:gamma-L-glutamate ligase
VTGPGALTVLAPDGVPEVAAGDDLVELFLAALGASGASLAEGDVVLVTSKVVAKAEGRVRTGDRDEALAEETVRVVARRGPTTIVRTLHGLTMAAAGIDASNVTAGHVVLLPRDPDASARALRAGLHRRTGLAVGVLVTDTAGRAWREGQTDLAIGAAGVRVAEDFAGRRDAHGNELAVTAPAVADELAGAAELAQGKLGGRPFAVVRGRPDLVLPAEDDGPGARALVRPDGGDLFGYGAREAVLTALVGDPSTAAPFGAPVEREELLAALARVSGGTAVAEGPQVTVSGPRCQLPLLRAAGFALGWTVDRVEESAVDDLGTARVRVLPRTGGPRP